MDASSGPSTIQSIRQVAPTQEEVFLGAIKSMEKEVTGLREYSQKLTQSLQSSVEEGLTPERTDILAKASCSDRIYEDARRTCVQTWYELGAPDCNEIHGAWGIHHSKGSIINQLHETVRPYGSAWLRSALDSIPQKANNFSSFYEEYRQDPAAWKTKWGVQGLAQGDKLLGSYLRSVHAANLCAKTLMDMSLGELQESQQAVATLNSDMNQFYHSWKNDTASFRAEAIQWGTQVFTVLREDCANFLKLNGSVPVFSMGNERADWEREVASSQERLRELYRRTAKHNEELKSVYLIAEPASECRTTCEAWSKMSKEVKDAFRTLDSRGEQGSSLGLDSLNSVLDDL
ncbi:hypothetical protein V866_000769 [Kwoniella sp. B9012]